MRVVRHPRHREDLDRRLLEAIDYYQARSTEKRATAEGG
jgi:hypothetical protein